jgi:hypothetical protein
MHDMMHCVCSVGPQAQHPSPNICRLDGYAGSINVDADEVSEAKWVALEELQRHAEAHPEEYTQVWLPVGWSMAAC